MPPQFAFGSSRDASGEGLARFLAKASESWPMLRLDLTVFVPYLAQRSREGHVPPLANAGDIYLACACAHRVAGAYDAFDKRYSREIRRAILRTYAMPRREVPTDFVEEAVQRLREGLFVSPQGLPRIAEYRGEAPLRSWVTVAASSFSVLLRAQAWLARAFILNQGAQYEQAAILAERAREVFERAGDDRMVDGWFQLGTAATMRSRYDEARVYFRRVIDRRVQTLGAADPLVSIAFAYRGRALHDEGRYDEAIEGLARSLAITKRVNGEHSPMAISTKSTLADSYVLTDRPFVVSRLRRIVTASPPCYGHGLAAAATYCTGRHMRLPTKDEATNLATNYASCVKSTAMKIKSGASSRRIVNSFVRPTDVHFSRDFIPAHACTDWRVVQEFTHHAIWLGAWPPSRRAGNADESS